MFEDREHNGGSAAESVEGSTRDPGKSTRSGALQLKASGGGGGSMGTAESGFSGPAMDLPYRSEMESGFGTSFSSVQAYGGAEAQAANAALGSRAYAVGNQVAFDTPTPAKEVVAHELAHTIQQSGGSSSGTALQPWTLGGGDPFEAEADAAAHAIVSGQPAQVGLRGPSGVQKWGGEDHYTIGTLAGQKAMKALEALHIDNPGSPTMPVATAAMTAQGAGPGTHSAGGAEDPKHEGLAASGTGIQHGGPGQTLGIRTDAGTISFGAASRYGGDYATTVRGIGGMSGRGDEFSGAGEARRQNLAGHSQTQQQQDANNKLSNIQFAQMTIGGTTNANHFYPVNGMEYRNHHNLALGHARQAAALAHAGDQAAAAEQIRQAMMEEGFANHFLQDTFSAGHMAPRSLDSTDHLVQDPQALELAMNNTGRQIDQAAHSVGSTAGNVVGNVSGFFSGAWNRISNLQNPFSEEGRTQIAAEMQNQASSTATRWGHSAQQTSNAVTGTFQAGGTVSQIAHMGRQMSSIGLADLKDPTNNDAVQGLLRTKQWHDFFCALPNGIPTTRGRFHGDHLMDGNDLETVSDTASNSIIQVMSMAHGKATNAEVAIPTPDIGQILADPMAGPAWRMMMSDYQASMKAAKAALAQNPNATTTTDGGTTVSSAEVLRLIDANIFGGEDGARQSPEESQHAAQAQAQVDPSGNLPRQRGLVVASLQSIEYYLMTQFGFNANLGVDDNLNAPVETDRMTGDLAASEDKKKGGTRVQSDFGDGGTGPSFDPCQLEGRFRLLTTLIQQIGDYEAGLDGALQNASFSAHYQRLIKSEQATFTQLKNQAQQWKQHLDQLTGEGLFTGPPSMGLPIGLRGETANNAAWGAGHPEFISNHVSRRQYRMELQGQLRPIRERLEHSAPTWGKGGQARAAAAKAH